ncbi:hypothetical protein [Micromonospora sp. CMU55-4]|uniref:hypothetical protein n=1 Tax=Micromonospora sp. CMU55-4 TaxID=2717028 RepID=UPI0014082246|nr:hypothetical protein [Micromonospora sp. CMU55-4]NHO84947.1 hypothetical protein [Micromonospora sp. CMU55-4]
MARDYTSDGTYWTVRKVGKVYWVVRIDNNNSDYRWAEIWGGYYRAGAAGGAAAELAYNQGKRDVAQQLKASLHGALDSVGLGAPKPAPVQPDAAKIVPGDDEDSDDE